LEKLYLFWPSTSLISVVGGKFNCVLSLVLKHLAEQMQRMNKFETEERLLLVNILVNITVKIKF